MDPYVYPNSSVLINKLNILDEQELIDVEAQLLIAGIIDIHSIMDDLDFRKYSSLQTIHRFLFEELYTWAGEFRTINIYKSERVLNGLSITYSNKSQIISDLKRIFKWAEQIQWTHQNPQLPSQFAKLLTDIWRVHPYREGNTRTVSIFMKLFADKHNLTFNAELLSQNAGYLRNALVMAGVDEAPEPSYLHRIITDALSLSENEIVHQTDSNSEKYQSIGQYDVSNYEGKPFNTKTDESQ
ncbi:Fic family protein [Solibacillus sp. FSL R7-0668]|uniref:Fic/DOC family protein n=1 Tax=Solibacillus sp. FSL R7-0668 TaxID=2921688 RepID=UPI0030F4EB7F